MNKTAIEWKFKKGRILFEVFVSVLLIPLFLDTGDKYDFSSLKDLIHQIDFQELVSLQFLIGMGAVAFILLRGTFLFRGFAIKVSNENLVINRLFYQTTIPWKNVNYIFLDTSYNFNNGWPNLIVVTNNGENEHKILVDIIAVNSAELKRTLSQYTEVKGS